MPMNTAGFDCRAPRIMGDWMVGLPSVRKLVQLATLVGGTAPSEDALPTGRRRSPPVFGSLKTGYDDNPQPYVEVPPDSPLYAQALKDARARMVEYHQSVRYQYCQDVISPDIYDPFVPVVAPEYPYHPDPYQYQLTNILEEPPRDPMHQDRYRPAPHRRSFPRSLDQLRPDRTAAALGPQADGLEGDSRRWRARHRRSDRDEIARAARSRWKPARRRRVPAPARVCRAGAR